MYEGIARLVGLCFIRRDFVVHIKTHGLSRVCRELGIELTADQRATFESAFKSDEVQAAVAGVWQAYDAGREAGTISAASKPWEP